ncbi:glutathione S-transferase family protein [Luteimonas aquatica]|uniref:glutathione S-transferase family protein n=1 Tax=Luteimonas aquatica TaxID=450364 RepID=UPI001F58EC67|nr:glutathione S-transferase family protein [Luteimonas aquatica]
MSGRMILIGMLDSSYVRRVAITLDVLGLPFERRDWSVGRDFERIREFNPLGRVPALVLDSGETLIESAVILDHLERIAGPQHALLPSDPDARRRAQYLIALAGNAADKAVLVAMERIFRPAEKWHEPFLARCRTQIDGALAALEQACRARQAQPWLAGEAMSQADISLTCFVTHASEAAPWPLDAYPALRARVARCEALPLFRKYYVPFDAPIPTQAPSA